MTWIVANGYVDQHWLIEAGGKDRGKIARFIMSCGKMSGFGFAYIDHKVNDVNEWLNKFPSSKIVVALGYK